MKVLSREYIDIDLEVQSKEELFDIISDNFEKVSVVKKSYREAIKERESIFPTGLKTEKYGVAIPHTDIDHAQKNAIGFYRLVKPINFGLMGEETSSTNVVLVFPIVVKDADDYMKVLSNMMGLLQNTSLLDELYHTDNINTVLKILEKNIEKENIYE